MATEGLGRYFKKELRERKIKGLRLFGNNLPITHQQFVDDIMLFCEVSIKEVRDVKKILDMFMRQEVFLLYINDVKVSKVSRKSVSIHCDMPQKSSNYCIYIHNVYIMLLVVGYVRYIQ